MRLRIAIIKQMSKTQTTKKPRHRSSAKNKSAATKLKSQVTESDGTYFLKLVIVILLATVWIKLAQPLSWSGIPFGGFPVGAIIGLAGILLIEKNQTDRKIWYAVLVIVTIVSYFLPAGIII